MRLWERVAAEAGLEVVPPPEPLRRAPVWCVVRNEGWFDLSHVSEAGGRELPATGLSWDDAYDTALELRLALRVMSS